MKLDRNTAGSGKYALLKMRKVRDLPRRMNEEQRAKIHAALELLEAAQIIDWANTPETECFVIRLKDENASTALFAYGCAAHRNGDAEYGDEVIALSRRSGDKHPNCKKPD